MSSEAGRGMLPRAGLFLFDSLRAKQESSPGFSATVLASYLEIYNETLFDLLGRGQADKQELNVRVHPVLGPIVPDLTECPMQSCEEAFELFDFGAKRRAVAASNMNANSSRSHAIFTMQIRMQVATGSGQTDSQARVHFVDLAGSERQKKTACEGAQLKEGISINQSLTVLGRVISALTSSGIPPFRDSKLTILLKDALMGNSRTMFLACISPASYNTEETIATLEFVSRCKLVTTAAKKNEQSKEDFIAKLRLEKEEMEALLQQERLRTEDLCKQLELELQRAGQAELAVGQAVNEKEATESQMRRLKTEHDEKLRQTAQKLEEMKQQELEQLELAKQNELQSRLQEEEIAHQARHQELQAQQQDLQAQINAMKVEIEKAGDTQLAADRAQNEKERLEKQLDECQAKHAEELQQEKLRLQALKANELRSLETCQQAELRLRLEEIQIEHQARQQELEAQIEALKAVQQSWELDKTDIKARSKSLHAQRTAELSMLGLGTDGKDMTDAPRLINLHPDPALEGCLLYYLRLGETTLGSDNELCDIKLHGLSVGPEACVISNRDNQRLMARCIKGALVRVNGQKLCENEQELGEQELQDGDRLAIGRAYIFQVKIPMAVRSGGAGSTQHYTEAETAFEKAMEEISSRLQVDPEWESGLQRVVRFVKSEFGTEAASKLLEKAKRASEQIDQGNELLKDRPDSQNRIERFELSVMFDSRGVPEVLVVARKPRLLRGQESWGSKMISLSEFLPPDSGLSISGKERDQEPSAGIWEIGRFQDEYLPALRESVLDSCLGSSRIRYTIVSRQHLYSHGDTYYTIQVVDGNEDSVHRKCYNDFQDWDKFLKQRSPKLSGILPPLPDQGTVGVRALVGSTSFLDRRQHGLQRYLDVLAQHVCKDTVKTYFLGRGVEQ
eukprot:TRINITY_DN11324_c0_g1_i1.p1 TRINITY_DN11324_c0_g1~~TRINITY_DN11324_c0_g1_i1.p1  ORF type:complete len:908 (-),score=190.59 TRINITY_DN11324_c0_g1_i1:101-2824(-)